MVPRQSIFLMFPILFVDEGDALLHNDLVSLGMPWLPCVYV